MAPGIVRWALATAALGGAIGVVLAANQVLLVLFLGVLLGILLDGVAGGVQRVTGLSRTWSARVVLAVLVALAGVGLWRWGPVAVAGVVDLVERAPELYRQAVTRISATPLGEALVASLPDLDALLATLGMDRSGEVVIGVARGLGAIGLIGVVGLAVGLAPARHARWLLGLVGEAARPRLEEVGHACHRALQYWLVGRLVDMTVLMVLTAVGLWWLDIPFALGLAVIAGLLEFIPYVGPVLSVFPAIVVALTLPRPEAVIEVMFLYAFLQVVQSYVITPLIEQRAVRVPPALGLAAQASMAVLTGPVGVLVATPLVVVAIVLVQTLYVRDRLHQAVRILGTGRRREQPT